METGASTIKIETATLDDCPALAVMNRQLIDDEGDANTMTVAELESRMRDWLQKGVYTGYLFKAGCETIGYALIDPSDMWMRHFFICRACRRQGYGRKAVGLLFEQHGAKEIGLSCMLYNDRGLAFWRSFDHEANSMKFYIRNPNSERRTAKTIKPKSNVTIREIEERDYLGALSIWNNELGNRYFTAENIGLHHAQFKENENYKAFVAELDGSVAGLVYLMQYAPWGTETAQIWIQGIGVRRDLQGQGIGTLLLEHTEKYAREKGIGYITLNTGYKRTAAHTFYQRHGYDSDNYCFGKKL